MPRSRKRSTFTLPLVEVRRSGVHGDGAFAASDLPAGRRIGRYTGRRYSAGEARCVDWDDRLTYLFGLSDGTLIDGAQGGNATRHLNHACEPNCEVIEHCDKAGRLSLIVLSKRAIRAGEELFIDYALDIDATDEASNYPCGCGLVGCRGTMVAPPSSE